jgi:homocysteine S-methyltransferase
VKFIGGCCGTTPEHTKVMVDAVRALSPGRRTVGAITVAEQSVKVDPTPFVERSRFANKIATINRHQRRNRAAQRLRSVADAQRRAGLERSRRGCGQRSRRPARAIPHGALAVSLIIEQQVGIEAVTHYCCRDRNLLGMLSDLLGAAALGLRNFLIITGDPRRWGRIPTPRRL